MLFRFCPQVVAALIVSFVGGPALFGEPTPTVSPEIKSLEDEILARRRALGSAHFHLFLTRILNGVPSEDREEYTIYCDGLKLRQDRIIKGVRRIECFGEEHLYKWRSDVSPTGAKFSLEMHRLKSVNKSVMPIYDPLKIMLHPGTIAMGATFHMESFVNSPDRKDFTLEKTTWDGQPAIKVSCLRASYEGTIHYSVVPSRGFQIVRMELAEIGPSGTHYRNEVECSLQHVRDDLWFPKTVKHRRSVNGTVVKGEDVEIQVLSLNEPLDPTTFHPVTMNIPAGTLVSPYPADPRGSLKWDGNKMVVMGREEVLNRAFKNVEPVESSQSSHRLAYLVISAILATVAGLSIWWRYLRRRPNNVQRSDPIPASGQPIA